MACNPLLICSESPHQPGPVAASMRAETARIERLLSARPGAPYTIRLLFAPLTSAFSAPPLIADAKSNGALVPLALTMSWSRRCGTLHLAQALHQAVERLANLNASARWVGSVGDKKGSLFNGGEQKMCKRAHRLVPNDAAAHRVFERGG
jgi:hypothetical protein